MDPLKQFEIKTLIKLPELFGHNIDFTNASLYMLIAFFMGCTLLLSGIFRPQIVPRGMQCVVELIYNFISSLVQSTCGAKGLNYIGILISVFLFIFFCNFAGMLPLPFSFTVTSHIVVTLSISLFIFVFVTYIGFKEQGRAFFKIFLPSGTPWWLAPLMVLLELSTYLFRPLSLAIRLTANMIAGHTILKVIAGFVTPFSLLVSPLSFIFVVTLILFELFIAGLQAYIFVVLTCVYLGDSLVKH